MVIYLAWFLFIAACACLLPITRDEAYYSMWSQALDFGYFDHPPFVAWMLAFAKQLPYSEAMHQRGANLLFTLGTILVFMKSLAHLGFNRIDAWKGLALVSLNFGVLGLGVLSTPDTPLMFFWMLAFYEGIRATTGSPRRWVLAGLYCGCGLLAKYTMVLMAPIYLYAIIKAKQLRSPWPYLGLCLALLVFSPNLIWNSQNQWTTIAFQLRHGLNLENPGEQERRLPKPLPEKAPPLTFDFSLNLFEQMPPGMDLGWWEKLTQIRLLKGLSRIISFLGSQLAFLGLFAVPVFAVLLHGTQSFGRRLPPIVGFAAAFPLIFFSLMSFLGAVEANWALMYTFGASLWLAARTRFSATRLFILGAINVVLFAMVVAHSQWHFLPIPLDRDRVLHETHGYRLLGERYEQTVKKPVMAETYQLTSMINYYNKANVAEQYQGLTRDSEFTRNRFFEKVSKEDFARLNGFFLVTHRMEPQQFEGYKSIAHVEIDDCLEGYLRVKPSVDALGLTPYCQVVQRWYETEYVKE